MSRYIVLDDDEAILAGGPAAPTYSDWGWTIYRQDDTGKLLEAIGSDGGEPEDQLLVRDWKWVAPALDAAYQEGLLEGLEDMRGQREELQRLPDEFMALGWWCPVCKSNYAEQESCEHCSPELPRFAAAEAAEPAELLAVDAHDTYVESTLSDPYRQAPPGVRVNCDRCLLPLATPALMDHTDGCDCPTCRQHCWSEYGNYCTAVTGAQERARIVAELLAYSEQSAPPHHRDEAEWRTTMAVVNWMARQIESGVPLVDAEEAEQSKLRAGIAEDRPRTPIRDYLDASEDDDPTDS